MIETSIINSIAKERNSRENGRWALSSSSKFSIEVAISQNSAVDKSSLLSAKHHALGGDGAGRCSRAASSDGTNGCI